MYTNRKSFAVKCAIGIFITYLLIHILSTTRASEAIRELQQSGRNLAALDPQQTVDDPPAPTSTPKPPNILDRVKEITRCLDRPMNPKVQQRGDYWVLYNYIPAERRFKCYESITYTTHADYSFMDNLLPLLERWKGPISLALHAPGTDFKNTLESIAYLRDCTDSLVKELVTFHVYFSTKHVPKEVSDNKFFF